MAERKKTLRKWFSKVRLRRVRRRLDGMSPEDIALQLESDWAAYIRWRDRRVKVYSWIDGALHRYEGFVTSIKTMIVTLSLLFILGFASCITPLSRHPMFVLMAICLMCIPPVTVLMYGIIRLVRKIIRPVDYANGIGREMAGFLKRHHGRLKTLYKVFMSSNKKYCEYFDDDYMTLDKSVYYGVDKILSTIWSYQTCDSSDVFGVDGLYEDDVYTTYQLIRFMWVDHRPPLRFSRRETGLLVKEWVSLLSGQTDWSTYDGMVRSMIPEVIKATSTRESRDKDSILERLESIKHDSDVVNGSSDVVRMRDLVDRVHDSSVELVGRTVS